MKPAIYLSCMVLLIGSLVWTASADEDFEDSRKRVLEIFKDASPDSISAADLSFLVEFIDEYYAHFELRPDQHGRIANAIRPPPLVDGVPAQGGGQAQGGWIAKLLKAAIVQTGIEIASQGDQKAPKE